MTHIDPIFIRTFNFESFRDEGYRAIVAEAKQRGMHMFAALPAKSVYEDMSPIDGVCVTPIPDPKSIFSNQFHADVQGQRRVIFDFRVYSEFNSRGRPLERRRGYICGAGPGYAELVRIRQTTLACGFCGARHAVSRGKQWCDSCLGSPYLTPTYLRLLALRPLAEMNPERDDPVPDSLIADYNAMQTSHARAEFKKRIERRQTEIERRQIEIAELQTRAKIEAEVLSRLVDAGVPARVWQTLVVHRDGRWTQLSTSGLSESERGLLDKALGDTGLANEYHFTLKQ